MKINGDWLGKVYLKLLIFMVRTSNESTAVLYFSLSPAAEAKKKRFSTDKDFQTNVTIAKLMRDHTLRQCKKSKLPLFVFDEHNQTGRSFGEKLINAYSVLFNKGFEHVIAVGNDTPQLSTDHLTRADRLFRENEQVILGPSTDGGTWMMGLSSEVFNPALLHSILWNKETVFDELIEAFGPESNIQTLEMLADIDSSDDLDDFLANPSASSDISRLRQTKVGLTTNQHTSSSQSSTTHCLSTPLHKATLNQNAPHYQSDIAIHYFTLQGLYS